MATTSLAYAQRIARILCKSIAGYCKRVLVVGSIRRRKPQVNDIDLLIIPAVHGAVDIVLWARKQRDGTKVLKMERGRIQLFFRGMQVDIYLATEESWWTLALVRTGSAEHNIALGKEAKSRRWQFKANGAGLIDAAGVRIGGDTEESFFEAFGWPYKEPWERN